MSVQQVWATDPNTPSNLQEIHYIVDYYQATIRRTPYQFKIQVVSNVYYAYSWQLLEALAGSIKVIECSPNQNADACKRFLGSSPKTVDHWIFL